MYATAGDGQVLHLHRTAGGPEHWDYVAYLVEYYPTENAHFGTSLALDGFRLAIGSPGSTLFGQPPTSDRVGM